MSDAAPPPTASERLEAEARRLDCLPAIQPLLDIIDWCGRESDRLDDLEALLELRPQPVADD